MILRKRTTPVGRNDGSGVSRRRRRLVLVAGLLVATMAVAGLGPAALIEARSGRAQANAAAKANRPPKTLSELTTTTTSTTVAPTTTTSTTVAPTTTVPVATTIPPPPTTIPVPSAQTLWHANADVDQNQGDNTLFWKKEVTSGDFTRLSIVDDPKGMFGKVYRANLTAADIEAGDDRAEWRGSYVNGSKVTFGTAGQNLWYGWRSMFGGDVALDNNENDGNYMQLKGDSSCGGPAVGMTIRYNRLSIRTIDGNYLAWNGPLMSSLMDGRWHDLVLHVNYSKTATGYLELWVDGQPQAMANGQFRIFLPTMCPNDTNVFWKLGTYGMDVGIGAGPIHWTESPRIGTSYGATVPR